MSHMNIIEKDLEGFKDKISNSKLDYPRSDNKNLFNLNVHGYSVVMYKPHNETS